MAQVQKVRANENIGVIDEILDRDGCIVIENVLDKGELKRLKKELAPHFDETPNCTGDFYGHATKRVSSLIAKSALCQQMAWRAATDHASGRSAFPVRASGL